MIARAGSGWQTLLADLSLILFMVTAAALSQSPTGKAADVPQASARSEPLALWRAGEGAPPLGDWLKAQNADARQQLTIITHYPAGKQVEALGVASAMLTQAQTAGINARLLVEPGEGGIVASLAYDLADAGMAQGLQPPVGNQIAKETVR